MTSINPINVNAQRITSSYNFGSNAKTEDNEDAEVSEQNSGSQQSLLSANDVLNYMTQSAVSVTPAATNSIDTSQYVDGNSASRISSFMSQFEDIVATNLGAISQEFPDLSSGAQQTLALAQVSTSMDSGAATAAGAYAGAGASSDSGASSDN